MLDIDLFLSNEERTILSNEFKLMPTLELFRKMVLADSTVTDKTGVKTVELLGWQCRDLNPWQPILTFGSRETSVSYCKKELEWYNSQDLSVKEIGETAKIWKQICSSKNEVNSNYGWCIFSNDNYNQYENALNELCTNQDSRRAVMIFTRPSMWKDYNRDGMCDFICTWGVHCFIRNKKLYYIINQRSCDFWFGLRNDFVFHCYIYQQLFNDLLVRGLELEKTYDGIIYNCDTIHLYERHFGLLNDIV